MRLFETKMRLRLRLRLLRLHRRIFSVSFSLILVSKSLIFFLIFFTPFPKTTSPYFKIRKKKFFKKYFVKKIKKVYVANFTRRGFVSILFPDFKIR